MTQENGPSLTDVLARYDITLSPKKIDLLEKYCQALWDWNQKLNLTRHDDYEKFVTRDLVDSMKLAALLQKGEHILDVGTGGGVPGVVLAILRPDLNVELCDATGKKATAVGAIVDSIGLELNVWHAKAEELVRANRFHTLVIRAVSKLDKLLTLFAPVWFAFDRILMIKGPSWSEERGEARHFHLLENLALRKVADYVNPGLEHESVILQVCQKKRFAEMEKRAEDLAAGLPIEDLSDIVAIESETGPARQAGGARHYGNRGGRKPGQRSGRPDSRSGGRGERGGSGGRDGKAGSASSRPGNKPGKTFLQSGKRGSPKSEDRTGRGSKGEFRGKPERQNRNRPAGKTPGRTSRPSRPRSPQERSE